MAEDSVVGAFSEDQAANLSQVSLYQLRAWDKDGFFSPSYGSAGRGVPFSRIYSFRDIVSLRVLNDLRNNVGCSLGYLKLLSAKLSHLGDAKWTATTLYILGKRVILSRPSGRRSSKEDPVSGQQVLDIPLRQVIASTRNAIQDMNVRDLNAGVIVRSKFTNQNEPVFAGTRILVSSVQQLLAAGYDVPRVIRLYPGLTQQDLIAASEYQVERERRAA